MPQHRPTRSAASAASVKDARQGAAEHAAIADGDVWRLLQDGAAQLGLPLSDDHLGKLRRYAALLSEWGQKMNLTALREDKDVVVRHFLDSLALVRELPTTAVLQEHGLPTSLVDIGSGAGFPGALCALLRPELSVTLCERIGKKAAFLMVLRRELGLRYEVFDGDAERLTAGPGFGIVVSRAALPPPEWLALASRLGAAHGFVYCMTSPREPLPDDKHLASCGLTLLADVPYDVGGGPHRILRLVRR
jgi:16S rRNA (guanine527-N7)-methyltransferase